MGLGKPTGSCADALSIWKKFILNDRDKYFKAEGGASDLLYPWTTGF